MNLKQILLTSALSLTLLSNFANTQQPKTPIEYQQYQRKAEEKVTRYLSKKTQGLIEKIPFTNKLKQNYEKLTKYERNSENNESLNLTLKHSFDSNYKPKIKITLTQKPKKIRSYTPELRLILESKNSNSSIKLEYELKF